MQTTSPSFSVWSKRSTLNNLQRMSCFVRFEAVHIVIHKKLEQNWKVRSNHHRLLPSLYINKASKSINIRYIYMYVCMYVFFLQNTYDYAKQIANWNKMKSPISTINCDRWLTKKHKQTIWCCTKEEYEVNFICCAPKKKKAS